MARINTASKGRVVGNTATSTRKKRLTECEPSKPFLFFAHPERWGIMHGAVVPLLGTLRFIPGVNNVSVTGDPAMAIAKKLKEGWIEIPWNVRGKKTSYLRCHEGTKGDVYMSEWETPHVGSKVITTNQAGYVEFLVSLVEDDVVPEPEMYVLEKLKAAAVKRAEDYGAKAHASPRFKMAAERALEDVELIESYMDDLGHAEEESEGAAVDDMADAIARANAEEIAKAKVAEEAAAKKEARNQADRERRAVAAKKKVAAQAAAAKKKEEEQKAAAKKEADEKAAADKAAKQ